MSEKRKKPVRLEFSAGLLSSTPEDAVEVRIRGSEQKPAPAATASQELANEQFSGVVRLRREVKGRAGKPVSVLYGFENPAVKNTATLKSLQRKLKDTLACGGTFDAESGEIILQADDLSRVRQVLVALGFTVKG